MLCLYDDGQVFHDLQANTKLGCGIHIQALRFVEVSRRVIQPIQSLRIQKYLSARLIRSDSQTELDHVEHLQ